MTLNELMDKVEKQDMVEIQFWDANMNMMRSIEEDTMDRFIKSNGQVEVKYIRPGNGKILVQIVNPNR